MYKAAQRIIESANKASDERVLGIGLATIGVVIAAGGLAVDLFFGNHFAATAIEATGLSASGIGGAIVIADKVM